MSFRRQILLFFIAMSCTAVAGGIYDSIFNNFLSETFHLGAGIRGRLEFPREMPGFLVVVMTGLLSALVVTRLAVLSSLLFAAGAFGMAMLGYHFWPMVGMMMLISTGQHLLMPAGATITLALSHEERRGQRMGQLGAVTTAGYILGCFGVWICFRKLGPQYQAGFALAGIMGLCAALVYGFLRIPHLQQPRERLVFRWRFWLYYALEMLAGARKQIFLTFGPWVLIKVYHRDASDMAQLMMTAALIGIAFRPLAGMAMDRLGERMVMLIDNVTLIGVCIGYGYAGFFTGSFEHARLLASACYVLDNLLFALGDARTLYLSRMASDTQELTSTLAMGVSINHIASMTIPFMAGMVWEVFGYERVFMAAAGLAVLVACFSALVPAKRHWARAKA